MIMNNMLTLPKLRRACTTCANDCYHCGARAETKEIDYKCWNCGKFSIPLACYASFLSFQRKGTEFPWGTNKKICILHGISCKNVSCEKQIISWRGWIGGYAYGVITCGSEYGIWPDTYLTAPPAPTTEPY